LPWKIHPVTGHILPSGRIIRDIHVPMRRAAARLAHDVSSIKAVSLDPADLNSLMTERSTW
jgi:hypothetical protein